MTTETDDQRAERAAAVAAQRGAWKRAIAIRDEALREGEQAAQREAQMEAATGQRTLLSHKIAIDRREANEAAAREAHFREDQRRRAALAERDDHAARTARWDVKTDTWTIQYFGAEWQLSTPEILASLRKREPGMFKSYCKDQDYLSERVGCGFFGAATGLIRDLITERMLDAWDELDVEADAHARFHKASEAIRADAVAQGYEGPSGLDLYLKAKIALMKAGE